MPLAWARGGLWLALLALSLMRPCLGRLLALLGPMLPSGAAAAREEARAVGDPATRVLAFGDSLTAGWTAGGARFHPYAREAAEKLGGAEVDVVGVSGETAAELAEGALDAGRTYVCAAGREWRSLAKAIGDAEQEGKPYTFAAILAGTNDLGSPSPPHAIAAAVEKLHKACWHHGIRTLALTIPGLAAEEHMENIRNKRKAINDRLRELVANNRKRCALLDLDAGVVPFSKSSKLWDYDGLHMTSAGYDAVGAAVASAVQQLG